MVGRHFDIHAAMSQGRQAYGTAQACVTGHHPARAGLVYVCFVSVCVSVCTYARRAACWVWCGWVCGPVMSG